VAKRTVPSKDSRHRGWTYFTNHALVLICLFEDPYIRLLDIAERIGITDRAVQKILADLERDGAVERTKEGRCNRYSVNLDHALRHPLVENRTVGHLLEQMSTGPAATIGLGRDG
jgi:predicted transcriptional regulator of viral defense system